MQIAKLHYLTQDMEEISHPRLAMTACEAGIRWVQLRVKGKPYEEWKRIAIEVRDICHIHHAKLIINDNVQLAAEVRADGVHLGKTDMNPIAARNILGPGSIIGGTANSFEDIRRLVRAGVDYIGAGPFRFTQTKQNLSPVLGMEGFSSLLEQMKQADMDIPLIAIGGIQSEDVAALTKVGIHGVAVSSAINKAENRMDAARKFLQILS